MNFSLMRSFGDDVLATFLFDCQTNVFFQEDIWGELRPNIKQKFESNSLLL